MACYINKNDITFFSISEGLKHQVVFSYLDDIDSNFIKEYRELIGNDSIIQIETAGARSGRGTIYEVATVDPVVGPFGSVDYFKMLWRRTENQTVGD